jgi:hypothetical protein
MCRTLIHVIVCSSLAASLLAAQGTPPPPGGMPGQGGGARPQAAATTLDKHELEQTLERFLNPDRFFDPAHPQLIQLEAGLILAEQLGRQEKAEAIQDIIDGFASVTCAPDDERSNDGEKRLSWAQALGDLNDAKLQSALFTAVRKRLSSRRGYLGESFALHLLTGWKRGGTSPIYADLATQEWLRDLRADGDFRLAVQAWALYSANATDDELWGLHTGAVQDVSPAYQAQISNLILHEATLRPSLAAKLRASLSPTLFKDERLHWTARREAWMTCFQLHLTDAAALDWLDHETNPYLQWLFRKGLPHTTSTPGAAPATRAPIPFFRRPLPTQRVVFVIDQSDSMHEAYTLPNKEGVVPSNVVEKEFADYLKRLGSEPVQSGVLSLSVIFFAGDADTTLPLVQDGHWLPANVLQLENRWGRSPRGGTNIYRALQAAFRDTDADTIVFFSDGYADGGLFEFPNALAEEVAGWNRGRGTRIVTLGPVPDGPGIPSMPSLLRRLAEVSNGEQLSFEESCSH